MLCTRLYLDQILKMFPTNKNFNSGQLKNETVQFETGICPSVSSWFKRGVNLTNITRILKREFWKIWRTQRVRKMARFQWQTMVMVNRSRTNVTIWRRHLPHWLVKLNCSRNAHWTQLFVLINQWTRINSLYSIPRGTHSCGRSVKHFWLLQHKLLMGHLFVRSSEGTQIALNNITSWRISLITGSGRCALVEESHYRVTRVWNNHAADTTHRAKFPVNLY